MYSGHADDEKTYLRNGLLDSAAWKMLPNVADAFSCAQFERFKYFQEE